MSEFLALFFAAVGCYHQYDCCNSKYYQYVKDAFPLGERGASNPNGFGETETVNPDPKAVSLERRLS